jgi:hypothetical protein
MNTAPASVLTTQQVVSLVKSLPSKARKVNKKAGGANRIPCPRPVAIGPFSPLPGALPHVPYIAGLDTARQYPG